MAEGDLKLGTQIDAIRELDILIGKAQKVVNDLKRKRAKKERRLLRSFDKEDIDGCKGRIGVAGIRKLRIPQIKNLREFHKYVLRNKALDLLQNRVSSTAWKARLDEGERVPGIEVFNKVSISVRARGNK
jgi:glycerophosphoryl diester phosphodiesterase